MQISLIQSKPNRLTLSLPVAATHLECGWPSPAADYAETDLDLNELLIKHPSATYFAWANGDSLVNHEINDGDLLIIDRAAKRKQGSVVVACIDGNFLVKILDISGRTLLSANDEYPPIEIHEDMDILIEGVVTHSIHPL